MRQTSTVGVLDKVVSILRSAAAAGSDGAALSDLVGGTGLSRATAHRLAVALETHGMLVRTHGRFLPGPLLYELAAVAPDPLLTAVGPVLRELAATTGESAQLYRRDGEMRRCVAAAEPDAAGLRDIVPVGARLPMSAGSAAQVLLAWETDSAGSPAPAPDGARFTPQTLARVRLRGWADSVAEREPGVASVSAPVRDSAGRVVAALSISGPTARLGSRPGERHSAEVAAAAERLGRAVG